ncbi:hypothetical protein GE09DRAFT_1218665 [Coniochaeta sp. 2T2.1]|nr:hypothetical protein GE09DRAFT_1218665 [Coniochaeta sp. 2T2.1]
MNGFLLAWIHVKDLGLKQNIVVLELMIAIMFLYSLLALGVIHSQGRSKRAGWLAFFIVGDVLNIGLAVGLITVLARAGLPIICVGLTHVGFGLERPDPEFTTIGFSDGQAGHKGKLDKLCTLERSVYFIAVGLVFNFMATIVLAVLRICEGSYTRTSKVSELLNSLERADDKEYQSPLLMTAPRFIPPPSEGIITRQTSLRSVATTHVGTAHHGSPPAIPRRPVPNRTSALIMPSPINEESETRDDHDNDGEEYGALVADGMRHEPQQQGRLHLDTAVAHREVARQQQHTPIQEASDRFSVSEEAGVVADGMRYVRDDHDGNDYRPRRQEAHIVPLSTAPPLDEESAALVSDGSRPMPNLPPYTPGGSSTAGPRRAEDGGVRLNGHGGAQPRVQDMKPSGNLGLDLPSPLRLGSLTSSFFYAFRLRLPYAFQKFSSDPDGPDGHAL